MIPIVINGLRNQIPPSLTIAQMLAFLNMSDQPLLVEHNGLALLKSECSEKIVSPNDNIELIQIVAGG